MQQKQNTVNELHQSWLKTPNDGMARMTTIARNMLKKRYNSTSKLTKSTSFKKKLLQKRMQFYKTMQKHKQHLQNFWHKATKNR